MPDDASQARWDGRRILFEVTDAGQRVDCAISLTALQDLSGFRRFKAAELLKCFAAAWPRIEAIALAKLRGRAGAPPALLHIWTDDVEDPPPASPAQATNAPRPA